MKATFFRQHGGPEVLEYGDFPDPEIGLNEVLVSVKACALNHLDIWQRKGLPGINMPMPHISGSDVAGVVLETGDAVKTVKKGDAVLLSPGQLPSFGAEGFDGRDSYSPKFQILGLQSQGGYAQQVVSHERFVVPISTKYSFEEWAAIPLVTLTAYHMLVTRAQVKAGETVLIHAAGSGVGSMAIQLAKFLGAIVYTTVGDEKKAAAAKHLGADEVILYRQTDFSEEVKALTHNRGVDVVFEHIGPETWPKNLLSLARGGRMVTCGATSGPKAEVDIRFLFSKQLSILGSYMGSFAELLKALDLVEKGAIKPVVDQTFALKDARAAQERMEARKNFGKILLKP